MLRGQRVGDSAAELRDPSACARGSTGGSGLAERTTAEFGRCLHGAAGGPLLYKRSHRGYTRWGRGGRGHPVLPAEEKRPSVTMVQMKW